MNKSRIIKNLTLNTESFSKDDIESSIHKIINLISDSLVNADRVEIRNFGVLESKPAKAKPKARNPKTIEEIFVPAHKKTHFKPGKILKNHLKKPT